LVVTLNLSGPEVSVALLEVFPRRSGSLLRPWQRSALVCCFVILFDGGMLRQARAQERDVCTPSAAVQAGLDALDVLPRQTPDDTEWGFHEKAQAAVKELLRQYPDDVFVQRRYIDTMYARYIDAAHGRTERSTAIEEYKTKLAANPGSAKLAYLYGVTLIGRRSPESVKLFDTALEKDPKFPWPHLALVQIYSSAAFRDKAKTSAHLKAFLDACPVSFEGYQELARTSDDKDVIRQRAAELRTLVEKRSDVHAIAAYQTVWALEFKSTPPSEYDTLRNKTAADVKRIRGLNLTEKREWYQSLEDGYKLTNDQKDAEWAKGEHELRYPDPDVPASLDKWLEGHHYLGPDATAETRRARYSELLAQTNQWVQERPNSITVWWVRLDAMTNLDEVASAEIEAAAHQFFTVAQKNAGPTGPSSDAYFAVAETLSKKQLQPSRVVEMGQKGLERSAIEERERAGASDLYDDKERAEFNFYEFYGGVKALGYVARACVELKQPEQAQLTLSKMDERLQDLKSLAGDKKDRQKSYLGQLSGYGARWRSWRNSNSVSWTQWRSTKTLCSRGLMRNRSPCPARKMNWPKTQKSSGQVSAARTKLGPCGTGGARTNWLAWPLCAGTTRTNLWPRLCSPT